LFVDFGFKQGLYRSFRGQKGRYGRKSVLQAFQLRKETESCYDTKRRPETVTTGTRQSVFAYDTRGNLASVTDPEENVFTYDYDDIGRVTAVHRPDITDTGNETVISS